MGNDRGWRLWNTLACRGKNQMLLIEQFCQSLPEVAVGLYSLQAGVTTVFSAKSNVKDSERSMAFIVFLQIQMSSWRTNKAIILCWDGSDRVLGRIDIMILWTREETPACLPEDCHVGMSQFISNISGFIPSHIIIELKYCFKSMVECLGPISRAD